MAEFFAFFSRILAMARENGRKTDRCTIQIKDKCVTATFR